jgi:hypothetical protein
MLPCLGSRMAAPYSSQGLQNRLSELCRRKEAWGGQGRTGAERDQADTQSHLTHPRALLTQWPVVWASFESPQPSSLTSKVCAYLCF